MTRIARLVVVALVALLAPAVAPAPASAATGNQVVPAVYSNAAPFLQTLVATDQLFAYQVHRHGDLADVTVVVRRSDGQRTVLGGTRPGYLYPDHGPYLLLERAGGRVEYDVRDGSTHALVSAGQRSEQLALTGDGGWVEVVPDARIELREVVVHNPDGSVRRRFATGTTMPYLVGADPSGVVWGHDSTWTYGDSASGVTRTVTTTGTCQVALSATALVTCDSSRIYRLDRGDLHVVQSWPKPAGLGLARPGGDGTAWVVETPAGARTLVVAPLGSSSTYRTSISGAWFAWSGPELLVVAGAHGTDAGIYRVAADHPGLGAAVDLAGPGAPVTLAASTGRVVTSRLTGSEGAPYGELRETSAPDGAARVPLREILATNAVVSGGLTASVDLDTPHGEILVVSDGIHEVARRHIDGGRPRSLSGHRAVVAFQGASDGVGNRTFGTSTVVDLRWRHAADITVPGLAALSGSTLVRLADDGSVRARDLDAGGAETVVRAAGVPDGVAFLESTVATDGTWVAWSFEDRNHRAVDAGVRRIDGVATAAIPAGVEDLELAGGRAAWAAADGSVHVLDLTSGLDTVVGQRASRDLTAFTDVALASDLVAWTLDDGSTDVHPLGGMPGSPRLLGGFTPARFTRDPGLVIDLAVDRPMSNVQLVVRDGSGMVVAATPSTAPRGDIRAVWNGRLADGSPAPDGTYAWSVTAYGPDGPLVAGADTALSGTAVLDTKVPSLTAALPPLTSDVSTTARARLVWSSDDPTARFTVTRSSRGLVEGGGIGWFRPQAVAPDAGAGSLLFSDLLTNLERFVVTVRDEAGNTRSSQRDVLTPYDERSAGLRFSSGWTRGSSSAYWAGTFTSATTAGAQAIVRSTTNRVAVVGTRCSSCGRFRLVIDGRLIRTVDTAASSTRVRQRLVDVALPGAPAAHTIKVVVEGTAHRPLVRLDALGLVR